MPIYEYKCTSCGRVTTVLVQGYKDPEGLCCEACSSTGMKRVMSGANYHRSASDRLSSYDPASRLDDSFYRDTRNIGLHAEHMLKKAGVKPNDEFKAKLERIRTDPSSVIKDED
ncbi:MAG TPA: zinc ribbon domain-containing protein [Deltaproteobacteria bacterium]|nr:zinc ribbon domain-containing protein [Deltaproteobacteria bacterium]